MSSSSSLSVTGDIFGVVSRFAPEVDFSAEFSEGIEGGVRLMPQGVPVMGVLMGDIGEGIA